MTKWILSKGARHRLLGKVISNNGDQAVVEYNNDDDEQRVFERFKGQEELSMPRGEVFQKAEPEVAVADFVKEFPVGGFIQLPYRPAKMYGVQVPKKNSTRHKMLVEDLIKELQTLPAKALIILSSDGEGNEYRTAYLVEGGEFDENDEHLEGCGLKVGDSFVVIWPHG